MSKLSKLAEIQRLIKKDLPEILIKYVEIELMLVLLQLISFDKGFIAARRGRNFLHKIFYHIVIQVKAFY